jgi:hypothetical protein
VALTWLLIAGLSVVVDGTLFGWLYNAHKADCLERSNKFMHRMIEDHVQGPIRQC